MSDILSQAEIEALLSSLTGTGEMTGGASDEAAPMPMGRGTVPARREAKSMTAYEVYDFRRPDKFAKDQLRTLQMIHETFARLLAGSLSAYLRVPVHVDLVSVEQIPYDEYMRSLTNSVINVFSMSPLAGQAIMEVEFSILFSMLDRLLGGPGSVEAKKNFSLTDIEKVLSDGIIERGLKDFHSAWEGIAQFTPKREVTETQGQFVQIVPPNDVVVSILFEIKVGELRGAMSVCIPYLLLKPITTKLSAQRWFSSSVKKNTGKYAAVLARRLEKTYLTLGVRLGRADLSVDEIVHLKIGDVVTLERTQQEEVEVFIGNSVKFFGRPGTRGKKLAIHINRINPDNEPQTRSPLVGIKE